MLSQLDITGFRAFKRLRLSNLARVNLLVGRNNSGKTSALEAVELLLGSQPEALFQSIARRDERILSDEERRWPDPDAGFDALQLFFGRSLSVGAEAWILGDNRSVHLAITPRPKMSARVESAVDSEEVSRDFFRFNQSDLVLSVTSDPDPTSPFALDKHGQMPIPRTKRRREATRSGGAEPVLFLGTAGASSNTLTELWGLTVGNPEEALVIEALQIVEPAVERVVHALTASKQFRFFLKLRGHAERVPLSTFGEGTLRLLTLAVHLSQARGGCLLVDEIDTGLHFTTLEQVWRLLLGAAAKLDLQVFATTHSYDCLAALAAVVEDGASTQDCAVFRIERGAEEAVRFDPSELSIALEHRMELRG